MVMSFHYNTFTGLTGSQSGRGDLDLTVGLVGLEGRCGTHITGEGFGTLRTCGTGTGTVTSIVRILLFIYCYQLEREGKTRLCISVCLGGKNETEMLPVSTYAVNMGLYNFFVSVGVYVSIHEWVHMHCIQVFVCYSHSGNLPQLKLLNHVVSLVATLSLSLSLSTV